MKRNVLLLLAFCLTQMALAQEEVAIEQTIDQSIGCLWISADWNVRLKHNDDNGYRVAVVVPERFADIAAEIQICNLTGDTLTILENTMLPKGTIVELEGNLNFKAITVFKEAKVTIDRLYVPQEAEANDYLYLMKKSEVSINQLVSSGEFLIHLSDESKLNIDT
ncbi:MAG: hypothetical protein IKX35_03830, partial [Bacteroidales bacterium]|nr:hypothetical protein [Bacteroidales bacterium]